MAQQTIGIGTVANDGTGDPLRTAFNKSNLNFTELYNNLGGVTGKSGAASALTGTISETVMATIAIPAAAMGANGLIRIKCLFSMPSSANTKTVRIRFGAAALAGTAVFTSPSLTTITATTLDVTITAANATNAQNSQGYGSRGSDGLLSGVGNVASAIDATAAQNIVISGQLSSAAETLTLLSYIVETTQ